ncbi:MAG TPA: hypothetical protein PKZ32_03610 [Candidatus Melainabacteria bacterium]|nr:hypothetical protein [Candidatus Melainabacteria bacterium]
MNSKKRVLLTVNPGLIEGKRFQTVRSMVTGLHEKCDLFLLPISQYDFDKKRVAAYRRVSNGKFERYGWIKPEADIWIVYTDGYWIDHNKLGFKHRRDYLQAQLDMHESAQQKGKVQRLINSARAERHCLKSWFSELDANKWGVIPTFKFSRWNDAHDLLQREKTIIAKPNWGGGGAGVYKLANEKEITSFRNLVEEKGESLALDYCFQPLVSGHEKRLWFVNGECVGGRKVFGRHTPWADNTTDKRVVTYFDLKSKEFRKDLELANKLCKKSELTIGSIDFIGEYINEINGAGTTFTQYHLMTKIADAREPLVEFLTSLVT